MNCKQVEEQLPAYVEGGPSAGATQIDAHLAACPACRASAHAQRVARAVLRARAAELSPMAPPGLRTRVGAHLDAHRDAPSRGRTVVPALPWGGRLSAFAAAAMLVLTVGAILLPVTTMRSTGVLAAQLALDHMKCFMIDGDADAPPMTKQDAEAALKRDYDFAIDVPASLPSAHLQLVAVRRCLYGDGRAAHLMYRVDGEPVSLFVLPGLTRPAAELSLFGHGQLVWAQGDRTYMLVARGGFRGDLARVASYLRTEAR